MVNFFIMDYGLLLRNARPRHISGIYLFVSLGGRDDDGQDADELEDGPQEKPIAQQALQEGGLRNLRGRQVQLRGHDAGHGLICIFFITYPCTIKPDP